MSFYSSSYYTSSTGGDDTSHGDSLGYHKVGSCYLNIEYVQGFASGYLASRFTLVFMYCILVYFAYVNNELNSLKTYVSKLVPLCLGAIVMMPIYSDTVNPVAVLIAVAVVEFLGDIIPEVCSHYLHKFHWNIFSAEISMRPDVDELQDRLQEFFLIVLGEAMIGLLVTHFSVDATKSSFLSTL
jgi:hypothetical protein